MQNGRNEIDTVGLHEAVQDRPAAWIGGGDKAQLKFHEAFLCRMIVGMGAKACRPSHHDGRWPNSFGLAAHFASEFWTVSSPRDNEGSGAPKGAPTAASRQALRSLRMLDCVGGAPLAKGARLPALHCGVLVSTSGRAFAGYTGRQRAPRRRLVVASRHSSLHGANCVNLFALPRRRPSAELRAQPAGAAPCSANQTSPEDAPR